MDDPRLLVCKASIRNPSALTPPTAVDVVIPTYRRPGLLIRCLVAIEAQHRRAARVIVVVRSDDHASKQAVNEAPAASDNLHLVEVPTPGVVAALAAGVGASLAPVVAFTDDDAAPRPDWLQLIMAHFEEPSIGGVGGRDVVPGQETPLTRSVGRFTTVGRLIGNHHLGTGPARDVDVLKGVNMAFRAEALALPAPGVLRGDGAQVDFEVLTCAWARRQGWRVVYDPAVIVDHEAAPRHGADQRLRPAREAIFDASYNSVVAAKAFGYHAPRRRIAYMSIVGSRDRPGVIRGLVALGRGERDVLARLRPALSGRLAALRTHRATTRSLHSLVVTAASLRQQT